MRNKISKIGIIGSGKMGTDIFYFLNNNFDFQLVWVHRGKEDRLNDEYSTTFKKKMEQMFKRGLLNEEGYRRKLSEVQITSNYQILADRELIIESIVEDVEKKKNLFARLDQIVNPDCFFVSNSSSLIPTRIFPESARKSKFAGLHFFYPTNFSKLIEIIKHQSLEEKALKRLEDFCAQIGKKTLLLDEESAFLVNKLALYHFNQAFLFVQEGKINPAELDQLVRENMLPAGPFDFWDKVGLDVILSSLKEYIQPLKDQDYFLALKEKLGFYVRQGFLGRKTKRGFYLYEGSSKKNSAEYQSVYSSLNEVEREKAGKELLNRLICLYINTAANFIEKGYVSEEDLEFASMECYKLEKGPMSLLRELGKENVYQQLNKFYQETGLAAYYPSKILQGDVYGKIKNA